ncbi:hypothetical protein EQ500_07625 [Lactobacillus sp. XV13L]|nr:hypothetical protein [Lactobacillus sp. XV13L]
MHSITVNGTAMMPSSAGPLMPCAGRALASGTFVRNETVCTKTLYHYVERGLLQIKATDLPECLSRKILAYHTPDELYVKRLDCIYQSK